MPLKRSWNAAEPGALAPSEIALDVYFVTSFVPMLWRNFFPCVSIWIRFSPLRVEPELEAVQIPLGVGLRGLSDLARKVDVDPIGRRPRLIDDDGSERHECNANRSREAQVDDRDGQATRDPRPPEARTSGLRSRAMIAATRNRNTT